MRGCQTAGYRPDHRAGVEPATFDVHRAAEARLTLNVDGAGGDATGPVPNYVTLRGLLNRFTKERLGGFDIASDAQPEVDRPTRPVNSTIKIASRLGS
jgi:hypothetical protein